MAISTTAAMAVIGTGLAIDSSEKAKSAGRQAKRDTKHRGKKLFAEEEKRKANLRRDQQGAALRRRGGDKQFGNPTLLGEGRRSGVVKTLLGS